MKKIRAWAITGSGYGDEGKGLMTDYFCSNAKSERVLNIKVNGGAQAGHTVCRIERGILPAYNRYVFHSFGSGTFAMANTHLGQKFLIDAEEIHKEYSQISQMFKYYPKITIDPGCRIVFTFDKILNQLMEKSRTEPHGTCGYGIFESVNRNHNGYCMNIYEAGRLSKEDLECMIYDISMCYGKHRIEGWKEHIDCEFLKQCAKKDAENIYNLIHSPYAEIMSLQKAVDIYGYRDLVFECSQGLELDWSEKRNFPHVTGSHTGLRNVAKELLSMENMNLEKFEACYVTRSYKTKHGDGFFAEQDDSIASKYGLYDRTNIPNSSQGVLRYGKLDIDRMTQLINADFESFLLSMGNKLDNCIVKKSLAVTHIDQTCETLITTEGNRHFTEISAESILNGENTYYSFGETAEMIIRS